MNTRKTLVLPERNPLTHAAHRRQAFWQITLPVLVGSLLLLLALVGVILTASGASSGEQVQRWANISLIWLILPNLVFVVLATAFFTAILYLVTRLLAVVPGYAHLVQIFFLRVNLRVRAFDVAIVRPLLKAKGLTAALRQVCKSIKKQTSQEDITYGNG